MFTKKSSSKFSLLFFFSFSSFPFAKSHKKKPEENLAVDKFSTSLLLRQNHCRCYYYLIMSKTRCGFKDYLFFNPVTACPFSDWLIVLTTMRRHQCSPGSWSGRGFEHVSRYISLCPHASGDNLTSHLHVSRGFFHFLFLFCAWFGESVWVLL